MPLTKTTAFVAISLFLFFSGFCKVYAYRYGRVVSFGDSLSDRGNYGALYDSVWGPNNPYIPAGTPQNARPKPLIRADWGCEGSRASNGILWCEQLFSPQQKHDNFAFLASESTAAPSMLEGRMGVEDVPGFATQIDLALYSSVDELAKKFADMLHNCNAAMGVLPPDQQLSYLNGKIAETYQSIKDGKTARKLDSNALYTVWIGMNDLRSLKSKIPNPTEDDALSCINTATSNIHTGLNRLVAAGAKHFVVCGLPTIFFTSDTEEGRAKEASAAKLFNFKLWAELQQVSREHPDINIIPIDIGALGEIITSGKYDLGISNIKYNQPCRPSMNTKANQIREDPNKTLFWDCKGHLTAIGNKILADYIRMLIQAPYSIIPQMQACEKGASQAGRNVSNRLFHLRGGLDVASSASALVQRSFSGQNMPELNLEPQEGESIFLKNFKAKKGFAVGSLDPLDDQKLQALPSLQLDNNENSKLGVFVSGDLYFGQRSNQGEIGGFRHTSKTLTMGGDYRFKPWLLAGIAMSYTKGNTRLNGGMGKIDLDGYTVTLYDSMKWGGFYLDSAASYGWNQINLKRHVPAFKQTATAQPIGTNWGVCALAGYDMNVGNFRFGPTVSGNYGRTKVSSYREDGGTIFNMLVHEQHTSAAVGSIGGHASYDWDMCGGTLTPIFRGSYDHEFIDKSRQLVTELSTMRGIPYRLPVVNTDHNYYRLGGGLNWRSSKHYSVSLDYETIVARKHSKDHFIFAKLRYQF